MVPSSFIHNIVLRSPWAAQPTMISLRCQARGATNVTDNSCTPSSDVCDDRLSLKNTPLPDDDVPLTTTACFGGSRLTFSVAVSQFDKPAAIDGVKWAAASAPGIGSAPPSVPSSERLFFEVVVVSISCVISLASSVFGEKS